MPSQYCCIPGCPWTAKKAKKNGVYRSFFAVRRPELAKSEEDKAHRTALRKFVLSVRDYTKKGDTIKKQLHKENACICDAHFDPGDLIMKGTKRTLKIGAVPVHHLPKAKAASTPRKLPFAREQLPPKVRHKCHDDVWKSVHALSQQAKGEWVCFYKEECLVFELQKRNELVPKIRVELDQNVEMKLISFYGWNVSIDNIIVPSLRIQTVNSFLRCFENLRTCSGMPERCRECNVHPIPAWDGQKVTLTEIFRSPNCQILLNGGVVGSCCAQCTNYKGLSLNSQQSDEMDTTAEVKSRDCLAHLDEWQRIFLSNQIRNASVSGPSQRRYHPDVLRWSAELLAHSPAAYKYIVDSKALVLPARRHIQHFRKNESKVEPEVADEELELNSLAVEDIAWTSLFSSMPCE